MTAIFVFTKGLCLSLCSSALGINSHICMCWCRQKRELLVVIRVCICVQYHVCCVFAIQEMDSFAAFSVV